LRRQRFLAQVAEIEIGRAGIVGVALLEALC